MKKFDEIITEIKETLKANLSADNTEVITKLDKNIDDLVESHQATQKKLNETQELFINQMKETGFKTPQGDDKHQETPITEEECWDAAMERALRNEKQ